MTNLQGVDNQKVISSYPNMIKESRTYKRNKNIDMSIMNTIKDTDIKRFTKELTEAIESSIEEDHLYDGFNEFLSQNIDIEMVVYKITELLKKYNAII